MRKTKTSTLKYLLREERKHHGWSQQQVADRIGTTTNNVSRWETGMTVPGPYFRAKLCDLFGKSALELELISGASEVSSPAAKLFDPFISSHEYLIGRDILLKQLTQLLCANNRNVVIRAALHGLPGVGKTALAVGLTYRQDVQAYFRDGIIWAGLGPQPNLFGLLSRWATLLGMTSSEMERLSSMEAWVLALRTFIGGKRVLLVLDDVWRIEDALALQVGGPTCASLVTTRFAGIAYQFANQGTITVNELSEDESMCLCTHLAPQVVKSEPGAVRELVRAVGGLPLALTLIGNYLQVQSHSRQPRRLRDALERLRDARERFHLIQPRAPFDHSPSLPAGLPLSLQTVIALSEQRLDEQARHALYALAVFPPKPNTFSEEAALTIADTQGETLDTLCDAGLLESRGSGRYTLHQTIVDYARTQGACQQAEDRMITYFSAVVESEGEYNKRLEQEAENILAAFQLACQREAWSMLVRGITAFVPFLTVRGIYPIVKPYLIQAHQALFQHDQENVLERASVCFHLGRIADFQGAYLEADQFYAAGLEDARSSGEKQLMVSLLAYWGEMLLNAGHYQQGEKVLLEGLQLSQAPGFEQQACLFFKNLGEVAASLGNYTQAIIYHQQGLALARQLEHWEMVSMLLQNLASHQACHGDFRQAEASFREALTYARKIGHLQRCSAALSGLGYVMLRQQCLSEAEACLEEGLALARKIQSPVRTGCVLQNLGILKSEQGDYAAAGAYLQESLSIASAIGHTWLISETLYYWGELSLKQDRLEDAFKVFEEAYRQASEQGEQELIALTAFGLARVFWLQGESSQANALAEESLALFRKMEHEQAERVAAWLQGRCESICTLYGKALDSSP